jgi:hypothetical protein
LTNKKLPPHLKRWGRGVRSLETESFTSLLGERLLNSPPPPPGEIERITQYLRRVSEQKNKPSDLAKRSKGRRKNKKEKQKKKLAVSVAEFKCLQVK